MQKDLTRQNGSEQQNITISQKVHNLKSENGPKCVQSQAADVI